MANRARDWLAQADHDLEHAEESRHNGRHEWACFASHQAAEKAAKALHMHHRQEGWGHVVATLLKEMPADIPKELIHSAQVLDNFYLPTRYPNGHPEGAPFEHYGPLQSKEAIDHARSIIDFVHSQMA